MSKDQIFKQWKEKIRENQKNRTTEEKMRTVTDLLLVASAVNVIGACQWAKKALSNKSVSAPNWFAGCLSGLVSGGEFLIKAGLGFSLVAALADAIDNICSEWDDKDEAQDVTEEAAEDSAPAEESAEASDAPENYAAKETVSESAPAVEETKDAPSAEESKEESKEESAPVQEPVKPVSIAKTSAKEQPAKEESGIEERLAVAEPVAYTMPVFDRPVVTEEPAKEEPIAEEPVKEEIAEEPVKEEPVLTEEPVKEEPVKEEPAAVETAVILPAATATDEEEDSDEDLSAGLEGYQLNYIDVKDDPKAFEELLEQEKKGEIRLMTRYRIGFTGRVVQSQANVQEYYSAIKNALLNYKGVKSRISWTFDTFHCGRNRIAKINVKNKTLFLYLALDPAEMEETKYSTADVSGKKKFEETPVLLKVKGERKFKYALELVEMVCSGKMQLKNMNREPTDYTEPYRDLDALVEEGAVKKMVAPVPAIFFKNEAAEQ